MGDDLMQIKTTSYQDMLESLCGVLELYEQMIIDIIDFAYYMFQHEHKILVMDDLYDYFIAIAKKYLKQSIDKVFFYNISRRLEDANNDGLSLVEVLTSNSSLSKYLKGYAFGDQLENNEIVDIVGGPEFFGYLFNYIDNNDEIIDNFME